MQTARREDLAVYGKAPSDIPALKPYWGKPAVRNFRESGGNVGIIRSPVRATALPGGSVPWRETDGALIDSSEKIISYSLEKAGDRSFTVGLAGMKMARHSAICRRVRVAQCRTLDFKSPRAPGQILSSPVHLTSRGENQVPVFG